MFRTRFRECIGCSLFSIHATYLRMVDAMGTQTFDWRQRLLLCLRTRPMVSSSKLLAEMKVFWTNVNSRYVINEPWLVLDILESNNKYFDRRFEDIHMSDWKNVLEICVDDVIKCSECLHEISDVNLKSALMGELLFDSPFTDDDSKLLKLIDCMMQEDRCHMVQAIILDTVCFNRDHGELFKLIETGSSCALEMCVWGLISVGYQMSWATSDGKRETYDKGYCLMQNLREELIKLIKAHKEDDVIEVLRDIYLTSIAHDFKEFVELARNPRGCGYFEFLVLIKWIGVTVNKELLMKVIVLAVVSPGKRLGFWRNAKGEDKQEDLQWLLSTMKEMYSDDFNVIDYLRDCLSAVLYKKRVAGAGELQLLEDRFFMLATALYRDCLANGRIDEAAHVKSLMLEDVKSARYMSYGKSDFLDECCRQLQ